jgi:hypothetical protein
MKLPHRRQFLHLAAGAAALPVVTQTGWAQAYPTRPVRLILGYAPGGSPDIVARLIGQWLSERLGQAVVIENRPGAASNIGTEAAVRAAPDGYTLLYVTTANVINATLYDKLNFNFMRDIAPVAGVIRVPNLISTNLSIPAKTIPEFISYAKAKPGKPEFRRPARRNSPAFRPAVQRDDGRHARACALYQPNAGDFRFVGGADACQLRSNARNDAIRHGRQAARARRDHGDALTHAAGGPGSW